MKNTKVRYKVVKKKTRYSAVVNGNSKYARRYLPGTIVEAEPGTMGIFVFKHKWYAEAWNDLLNYGDIISDPYTSVQYEVIRVLPLVKGRKRGFVHAGVATDQLDNYYLGNAECHYSLAHAPDDTYTHRAVKVLD